MITASHNPPEYNGFKICLGSDTIFGREIQNLKKIIESGEYDSGEGSLDEYAILPVYCDYLANNRFEAESESRLKEIKGLVEAVIDEAKSGLQ